MTITELEVFAKVQYITVTTQSVNCPSYCINVFFYSSKPLLDLVVASVIFTKTQPDRTGLRAGASADSSNSAIFQNKELRWLKATETENIIYVGLRIFL